MFNVVCHLNLVFLTEELLEPGQTAVTDECVPADPEVLHGVDVGGHVLEGGEVVVAQVQAAEAGQADRGRGAVVGEAGVVGDLEGLGEREVGQAACLHPPQQGTVTHLNRGKSGVTTRAQNTIYGSFLSSQGRGSARKYFLK